MRGRREEIEGVERTWRGRVTVESGGISVSGMSMSMRMRQVSDECFVIVWLRRVIIACLCVAALILRCEGEKQRERERERETDIHTDRQIDKTKKHW